jgi:hypothetical protein
MDRDEFVLKVFEILFGEDAEPEDSSIGLRKFSYKEVIEELELMNEVYSDFIDSTTKQ